MSAVLNRTTKEFHGSAHTPNFPVADWIINPDLSAVRGQPKKYWKISGDRVSLASASEQSDIDDAIADAREDEDKEDAKQDFDAQKVSIAFTKMLVKELNELRALHSLSDRTFAELRQMLRDEIDTG